MPWGYGFRRSLTRSVPATKKMQMVGALLSSATTVSSARPVPPPNVCSKKLLCKRSVLRKVMLRERWNCDKGWQRKVFPNCAANVIFPARHCVRTPPGPTFLAIVSRRTLLANQRFVCASACDVVTIRGVASKARDTRQ